MKIPSVRRLKGFTLVELLVVITIIMVLAAGGFAAGNAAIQKARRTTALATATSIESAVNAFYTEYGSMPKDGSSDGTAEKTDASGTAFLKVLLGLEGSGSSVLNTRAIKFLSAKEGKAKKNGLIYSANGSTVEGLFDPWGGSYFVLMDLDYNEQLTIPSTVKNGGVTLNGRRVAVWSLGADGVKGSGGAKNDDVTTWGP